MDSAGGIRRISTGDFPRGDFGPTAQDAFDSSNFGTKLEIPRDQPFKGSLFLRSLPGLDFVWARHTPLRAYRTRQHVAQGSDSVVFGFASAPRVSLQFGREFALAAGEGIAVETTGPGSAIYPSPSRHVSVLVPRKVLGPLLRESDGRILQTVPNDSPALRLLARYLNILKDESALLTYEVQRAAVAHIYDLLALALGATRDAAEAAKGRGVRAARLHAIKSEVTNSLGGSLSINGIAARHRITPRYMQMLFEDEGTTFTQFVREQRLGLARSMLVSPRFDDRRISDVAFDVGFGDLSYFNRAFNQRFGMSPGEARAGRPRKV